MIHLEISVSFTEVLRCCPHPQILFAKIDYKMEEKKKKRRREEQNLRVQICVSRKEKALRAINE